MLRKSKRQSPGHVEPAHNNQTSRYYVPIVRSTRQVTIDREKKGWHHSGTDENQGNRKYEQQAFAARAMASTRPLPLNLINKPITYLIRKLHE